MKPENTAKMISFDVADVLGSVLHLMSADLFECIMCCSIYRKDSTCMFI